jgi:hypothetical protein
VDEAIDRGWLIDDDAAHLESARVRIVRTSQVWDGTNRRQFERAEIAFEVLIAAVTKDAIDEELKTSYSETDAKFVQALEGLLAEARTESTRIQDLSAGGVLVLAGDKDQFHEGDYISFAQGVDEPPFDMSSLRGRILEVDKMEDQRQLQLHITFLPYDTDLRKEIIQIVYEAVERAAAEKRERKALVPKKKKAKTKTKAKAKAAKKAAAKKKAPVSEKAE